MLQKITDNDEQWEKAKKEVTQVVARHSVTQTKLDEQEQLTFMEEQRARVSDSMLYMFYVLTAFSSCYSAPSLCSTEGDGKPEEQSDRSDNCPGTTQGELTRHFTFFTLRKCKGRFELQTFSVFMQPFDCIGL